MNELSEQALNEILSQQRYIIETLNKIKIHLNIKD
ncbi:MAG: hypothetical protein ACFWTU_08925 [Leuconostoc mesenteroides]|jgi:hypothetical protein